MKRREIAECIALSLFAWIVAVIGAAAFMSLISCGGRGGGTTCPKPRLTDNGGNTPGTTCEVRK